MSTRRRPGERVRGQGPPSCWGATAVLFVPASTGARLYDARVTPDRSPVPVRILAIVALFAVTIVAACGPDAAPAGTASPATGAATPARSPAAGATEPDLTPVPGGQPTPFLSIGIGPDQLNTTDVEGFGPILDELPASFPRLAGQEPADAGGGPASGSFVVNSTPRAAAADLAAKLTAVGWSADVASPLEDGSVVVEATGQAAGCKAEVRFTPASGSSLMLVLYGASCPAS